MIPCEIYDQYENDIPYIHSKFVVKKNESDDKFVFLITNTSPGSLCGRYTNYKNWDIDLFDWLYYVVLPSYVVDSVKNKNCVVIIDDTMEGFEQHIIDSSITEWMNKNGLNIEDRSNIIYLTGNMAHKSSYMYTVINKPFIIDICRYVWFGNYNNGLNNNIEKANFDMICESRLLHEWSYKFVSLQQRPRDFRIELRNKLRDRYTTDESICTLKSGEIFGMIGDRDSIEVSPYDDTKDEYLAVEITPEHFMNIPYAVVSECNYYGTDKKLITEKILKNLIYPQPFVFCGYKNQLQHIRTLGFKIYDDLIDHGYDELSDDIRMNKMIDELSRILDIVPDDYINHAIHNRAVVANSNFFGESYEYISQVLFN